jgi:hypothetical protein
MDPNSKCKQVLVDVKLAIAPFLKDSAVPENVVARIKHLSSADKVHIARSLQTNNLEHRFETIAKKFLNQKFDQMECTKQDLDAAAIALKETTMYAIMKTFSDDRGAVQWQRILDILCGEAGDEDSSELTALFSTMKVG